LIPCSKWWAALQEALRAYLDENSKGLSANTVSRLKKQWKIE